MFLHSGFTLSPTHLVWAQYSCVSSGTIYSENTGSYYSLMFNYFIFNILVLTTNCMYYEHALHCHTLFFRNTCNNPFNSNCLYMPEFNWIADICHIFMVLDALLHDEIEH
jgi:hypothetical protein